MKKYLITGATGYVGSMLIKYLIKTEEKALVTAIVRDREKAVRMLPEGVSVLVMDLTDSDAVEKIQQSYDYLIHCAAVTKSAEMIAHPVEVTRSIVNATQNIMELARRCGVQSVVYLSSMEVYGNVRCSKDNRATEDEAGQGMVDLLKERSSYPLGKRMAENICYSYYKEYDVPVKIVRLAQTFGAGILPDETRVFAQFAKAAKERKNIVLHTKGESVGNYCSIWDAVKGILMILERGVNGEAYNVVNESLTMTIREMAELVADRMADGRIDVIFDVPTDNLYGYAEDTGLRLSGKKLVELGWIPTQGMEEMYQEVMRCLISSDATK